MTKIVDSLKINFPAWSKVFLQILFSKIWAQFLGAYTDSTVRKYIWVRHCFVWQKDIWKIQKDRSSLNPP